MSVSFLLTTDTGRNLFASAQQIQANGSLGDQWNVTTGQWETPPVAINDRQIGIVEGGVDDVGSYSGGTGQLGTYTGLVWKRIHDADESNRVVGTGLSYFAAGVEQSTAIQSDIDSVPAAVRAELQGNPVDSANMRGTDLALTAAGYTAPDNAGIASAAADSSTAATQSTTAATQSTAAAASSASVDGKLTAPRATNLDNLDVASSTLSNHSPADVQTELTNNPVPSSNMRGTELALTAAAYVAPDNAGISTAASQSTAAAASSASVDANLTTTRAGYLDNLSAGPVATQTSVDAINNSTRNKLVLPVEVQIPDAGSTNFTIDLLTYDATGISKDADSLPTITAANGAGTDRSINLSVVTQVGTGHYRTTYSVSSAHAVEQIVITANYVDDGDPIVTVGTTQVVDTISGGGFTTSDRANLDAIFNKLPTATYFVGTAASAGTIDAGTMTGDKTGFMADVSLLALESTLAANPAAVQVELTNNPVPSSNMRGTDTAFLAATWIAPDNTGIATSAAQSTTAATQATTAATEATKAANAAESVDAKLTITRANNLDNLDVLISSRSTFDAGSDTVTLTPGQDVATETTALAIKAKTDLLPASPAAVSDIPTAGQIASQTDATLSAVHGVGLWDQWSDATLAKQDQILALLGGLSPSPPSPVLVAGQRTWFVERGTEGDRAPQIVSLSTQTQGTVAMDFADSMNPGTSISAVSSVTDVSGTLPAPVVANLLPSQNGMAAHFDLQSLAAGSRYEFLVTIVTTDQQTLTGKGLCRVDD